jgi:hypothetical protein
MHPKLVSNVGGPIQTAEVPLDFLQVIDSTFGHSLLFDSSRIKPSSWSLSSLVGRPLSHLDVASCRSSRASVPESHKDHAQGSQLPGSDQAASESLRVYTADSERPVFFTGSSPGQEEKLKRPSSESTSWLLVSPMLEKIPTPTESAVSLVRSLASCGPIPRGPRQSEAAESHGALLRRHRGDRLLFLKQKREVPQVRRAPRAPGALSVTHPGPAG